MQTNLVQVQFKTRHSEEYGGRPYTYIADQPLIVGDIVTVPTKFGDSEAKVIRIDVPEEEVAAFRDALRHITEPAKVSGGLFDDFYN